MSGSEEDKKKLVEDAEATQKSPKKDGTRVFKKASPNGKITVYLGKRDFMDHVTSVDPIDGVVLIDPDYFVKEGKADRKGAYPSLPPPEPPSPQLVTLLQVRLMKKLGRNAYPFTFSLRTGLPSSITLQPAQNGEGEKPCGVDFILRCYVAKNPEDKIEKRNSVRLAVKKITHAPLDRTERPSADVTKEFMLSARPLTVEANLEKGTYYHGEPIKVNVAISNQSSRTVKKIRLQVRQFAAICLFSNSEYKCVVAVVDSEEGFPVATGGSLQRTYELTPLLKDNRDKRGLALDGQIKHEDTCLASSTILPPGVEETREVKENLGIVVRYSVKVRLSVAFGSDLTLQLPFTLTHPKPSEPVISQMVTLPSRQSIISSGSGVQTGDATSAHDNVQNKEAPSAVHDAINHNLISLDMEGEHGEEDFVFEEFVRLRVAGVEEGNETEA